MWISTEDLKKLMNNGMNDYEKHVLKGKIQRAEEREEELRQRKIAERNAFLSQVADLLREYPGKPLCPTDLQFMYYHRFGQQISCSKISYACLILYLGTLWSNDAWAKNYPRDVLHVHREESEKRDDKHTYYTWAE